MHIKKNKLIRMSDIKSEQVQWQCYPFIPYGKVTSIQGEPGAGSVQTKAALMEDELKFQQKYNH